MYEDLQTQSTSLRSSRTFPGGSLLLNSCRGNPVSAEVVVTTCQISALASPRMQTLLYVRSAAARSRLPTKALPLPARRPVPHDALQDSFAQIQFGVDMNHSREPAVSRSPRLPPDTLLTFLPETTQCGSSEHQPGRNQVIKCCKDDVH